MPSSPFSFPHGPERGDSRRVGAGCLKAWLDGVSEAVFSREYYHSPRSGLALRTVRERSPRGLPGGYVQDHSALSQPRISVEYGNLALGMPAAPEPGHALGLDV